MAKMTVFSVLYAVPAVCIIGCLIYEHHMMDHWRLTSVTSSSHHSSPPTVDCIHNTISSRASSSQPDCIATSSTMEESIPILEVFLLKIFMSLVTGITVSTWVWSCKTAHAWMSLLRRLATALGCGPRVKRVYSVKQHVGETRVSTIPTLAGMTSPGALPCQGNERFVQKYMINSGAHTRH